MTQFHKGRAASITGPAAHGFAVTPDDDTDLSQPVRALYVGSVGAVTVQLSSGAVVTFNGVAGGTLLPVIALRVHATGTTASEIVGLV